MNLSETRDFCEALWRFAKVEMEKQEKDEYLKPEHRWTLDEAVAAAIRTLHLGWIYYDGREIQHHEFVAVKPDAARAYLRDGTPWTEDDVIDRRDAPGDPPA